MAGIQANTQLVFGTLLDQKKSFIQQIFILIGVDIIFTKLLYDPLQQKQNLFLSGNH